MAQWNKVAQACGSHYSLVLPSQSGSQQRYAKWPDCMRGEEEAWPLRTAGISQNSHNTQQCWATFLIDTPFHYSRCACLHLQHYSCPHVIRWSARFYFCFSCIQFVWSCVLSPQALSTQLLPFLMIIIPCSVHFCFKYITLFHLNTHLEPIQNVPAKITYCSAFLLQHLLFF